MVTPERLMPAKSARICDEPDEHSFVEFERVEYAADVVPRIVVVLMGGHEFAYFGTSTESFTHEQDEPVDGEEDRRRARVRRRASGA